jgi:hypothetical protein
MPVRLSATERNSHDSFRGCGLAELVRMAEAVPLHERFARIRAAYPLPPPTGQVADKPFFDDLSGDGRHRTIGGSLADGEYAADPETMA